MKPNDGLSIGRRLVRLLIAVFIAIGAIIATVWILTKTLGQRDTLYRGKSVDYWAAQLNSNDPAATNEARAVLAKEILPQLTQAMFHDTNDSRIRLTLIEKLNLLPGVYIYFTTADGRRAQAARDIGDFGPAASAAVPALLQALKSSDSAVHGAALLALGRIHAQPEAIMPLLIGYLEDTDLRVEAAEALGDFGSAAKSSVPKLLPLLEIPDKDLRHAVTEALKKIDPEAAAKTGVR